MAEVLFVLLTVYVVYVVHGVVYKKEAKKDAPPTPESKPTVVAEKASVKQQAVVVKGEKPAVKKPVAKKAAPVKAKPKPAAKSKPTAKAKPATKAKTASKAKSASSSLRNPETGQVDKMATSYRMSKRWIKEALVTEGLLPKVYKTTEIDDAVKKSAKTALDKLAKMDKYTQDL